MIDRTRLKAALAAVNEATERLASIQAALERSNAAIEDAKERLHQVAISGSSLVEQRLAELRAGESLTAPASVKRVKRFEAEEELQLAQAAHRTLEEEVSGAKADLDRLKDLAYWEAVRIALDVAQEMVTELQTLNNRRRSLCEALGGLQVHSQRAHRPVDIALPAKLSDALYDANPPQLPGLHMPGQIQGAMWQRWRKRIDALIENPDADFDQPPAIDSADVVLSVSAGGPLRFAEYQIR